MYENIPTLFGSPAIGRSGLVYVPHLSGQITGPPFVAGLDPSTGSAIVTALTDVADGGGYPDLWSLPSVVIDAVGDIYYWDAWGLVSDTSDGAKRWTSVAALVRPATVAWGAVRGIAGDVLSQGGAAFPVLAGADGLVGNSAEGFVELSATDGGVKTQIRVPNGPALVTLLAGGLQAAAIQGIPNSTWGGTIIVNRLGTVVWSDLDLNAASVIPGRGVLYGIRNGQLVAEAVPVNGLDPGPWPMVAHDPGRTSSAAGTW